MSITLTQGYSFSFNNQTFGGKDSPYQIISVDGLESLPAIRNQDDNRGYADGMFSGRDFLGGRMISIIFNVFGNANGSAQENYNILQSVLLPQTSGTTPLYFLLPPNPTQFINARVRALTSTVDANYTYGYIVAQVQFFCPNPLYFSNNEQTATMAYLPPTGRTYNRVYNLVYDPASIQITTTVTNNGWTNTYPTITLNGPIENPIIGNSTQNAYLQFAGTYADTDLLVIDLYNKLVTLNGLPARNLLVSGTWFSASPGNNEYYLEGDFGSTLIGTTKAVVTWNSAYV
jgi:phage-related protein